MMKLRRYTIILLVLILVMSELISCKSNNNKKENFTETETSQQNNNIDKNEKFSNSNDIEPTSIPKDLNFNEQEITILERSEIDFCNEFGAEDSTDILQASLYKRDLEIQEKLNVKLNIIRHPGTWGEAADAFDLDITKAAMSGSSEYDIVSYYAYRMPVLATKNCFMNLHNVKYLDMTKPWWHKMFIQNADVYNNLYAITGDACLSSNSLVFSILFNKALMEDYIPDIDIYQMVLENKWIADNVVEITKDIYNDLNSDGKKDESDFYGWDITHAYDAFPVGCGITYTVPTDEGGYKWSLNSERNISIIEKLCSLRDNPDMYYIPPAYSDLNFFQNRHALFYSSYLNFANNLRDMQDDYGLLPYPKLDEAQDQYYHILSDAYSQTAVMTTCENPDAAGAVLELAGELSYKNINPIYFETTMKIKYLRDNGSAQMFDIIHDSMWYDFAVINTSICSNPVFLVRNLFFNKSKSSTIASTLEKKEKMMTHAVEQALEEYKK